MCHQLCKWHTPSYKHKQQHADGVARIHVLQLGAVRDKYRRAALQQPGLQHCKCAALSASLGIKACNMCAHLRKGAWGKGKLP